MRAWPGPPTTSGALLAPLLIDHLVLDYNQLLGPACLRSARVRPGREKKLRIARVHPTAILESKDP